MKFSVILPSFLGEYKGAASNREEKLIRAIESVRSQSFKDWELIVVADGCERTYDIVSERYSKDKNIDCSLIRKQPLWSGSVRQFGITKAKGEYIIYLDSDDYYGKDHLKKVSEGLKSYDWVFYNDIVKNNDGRLQERTCILTAKYQNGTANICHKRELEVKWGNGYGLDDWSAVQSLMRYDNFRVIPTPEYIVCHLPKRIDV